MSSLLLIGVGYEGSWPTGADGDLTVDGAVVVVPNGSVKNYRNISIVNFGTLVIGNGNAWTILGCSGTLTMLNGGELVAVNGPAAGGTITAVAPDGTILTNTYSASVVATGGAGTGGVGNGGNGGTFGLGTNGNGTAGQNHSLSTGGAGGLFAGGDGGNASGGDLSAGAGGGAVGAVGQCVFLKIVGGLNDDGTGLFDFNGEDGGIGGDSTLGGGGGGGSGGSGGLLYTKIKASLGSLSSSINTLGGSGGARGMGFNNGQDGDTGPDGNYINVTF